MKRLLTLLLLVLAMAGLVIATQQPGQTLMLAIGSWHAAYPISLVLIALLLSYLAIITLTVLVSQLIYRWRQWQWARRDRMSTATLETLTQGILALWTHRWADAQQTLETLTQRQEHPPILAWLGQAQAAGKQQDLARLQQACQQAYDRFPHHRPSIVLAQAQWLMTAKQPQLVIPLLQQWLSQCQKPQLASMIVLAKALHQEKKWDALQTLLVNLGKQLPSLQRSHLIPYTPLQILWAHAMQQTTSIDTCQRLWWSLPKPWQWQTTCLLPYLDGLAQAGEQKTARKLLDKACQKHVQRELIPYFAHLEWIPELERLEQLETWQTTLPQEPALLEALAEAYLNVGAINQATTLLHQLECPPANLLIRLAYLHLTHHQPQEACRILKDAQAHAQAPAKDEQIQTPEAPEA